MSSCNVKLQLCDQDKVIAFHFNTSIYKRASKSDFSLVLCLSGYSHVVLCTILYVKSVLPTTI